MRAIPLDVLALLLLVPAYEGEDVAFFLLVVPLLFYVLLALWHPLTPYETLPEKFGKVRLVFLARFVLLLVMTTSAALLPTMTNIFGRMAADPDNVNVYATMHDGAVQMEYGLDYLAAGKNPYIERYDNTPLQYYHFSGLEIPTNPAFDHFVYLPGFLLISFPIYKLFDWLDLFYDQRWIYLAAYVLIILLLPLLADAPKNKLLLVAAVGLNPLITGPVIIGMNDIMVFLALLLMVLLLRNKRFLLAAVFMGAACTLKQSAWFVVPFYFLLMWEMLSAENRLRDLMKIAGIIGLLMVAVVGSLALWNLPAFIQDVLAYPSGNVPVNYPIRGYTLGVLLVGAGLISSPLDSFPFWIFQLLLGLPLMVLLFRYQWKQNELGTMLLCASIFIFGMGFASRFFQSNYVGFVIGLMTLGFILAQKEFVIDN